MGHSPAKNLRALSRRNSWFSFNPNCMARSSITSWQTEDEVPDDVALDFGSTGFDGISARTEITVGPDAFVNGAGVAAGQLAIGSQQFLGELLQALVEFAPEQFLNGALRTRCARSCDAAEGDRKSTRLNSSHGYISYAVFCLKKKIYQ